MKTKPGNHRIGLVSLGCAKNLVDSERLLKQFEANGLEFVYDPSDFSQIDSAIINTCGFISDAKKESVDTILQYVNAKQHKVIESVYVMGCLSERYKNELITEIPEVDAFFGVNDLQKIVLKLGGQFKTNLLGERSLTTPPHYAYLKIAEGCNRKCSFCAIPEIRGKHISRTVDDILNEAKHLIDCGVKEINLISQDTTFYGLDIYQKRRLPDLLNTLANLKGLDWIRIHYTYPDGFPDDLAQVISSHSNICKYIDIPLQHISDRILTSMRRGMDGASTRMLIEKLRAVIPGVAIRTTFIAGYPGETRKEFNELLEFVKSAKFDRLGVFPYSHEEGTHAFKLKDSVSEALKKERVAEIMALQESVSLALNSEKVGQSMRVIIDRKDGEYYIGRSEFDSPEVDNEVLIFDNGVSLDIGDFYRVKILKAESFDLIAELI